MRSTRTFAELEVSTAVYDEIHTKLRNAGYDHAFIDGVIDMHGIALTREHSPESNLHTSSETDHG